MQPKLRILSTERIPQIIGEAFQLLMKPGIKLQLKEARQLLAEAGAQVDEEKEVVHIPEEVARKALETVPQGFYLYNRDGEPTVHYGGDSVRFDPGFSGVNVLTLSRVNIDRQPPRIFSKSSKSPIRFGSTTRNPPHWCAVKSPKRSEFIDAVKESGANLVVASALLTTTMLQQEKLIGALKDAGLREQVMVMVGGAPVIESYTKQIGADGYAEDAITAVDLAMRLIDAPA